MNRDSALQKDPRSRHEWHWRCGLASAVCVVATSLAGCGDGGGGSGGQGALPTELSDPPTAQPDPPTTQPEPPPPTSTVSTTGTAQGWNSAVLLEDGKVLILGGSKAELFDPDDQAFVPTGSLTSAVPGATATLLKDGRVLVTGGRDSDGNPTAELYDPLTGTFARTGSPLSAHGSNAPTLLNDGRVLFTGGASGGGAGEATAAAQVYDPAKRQFAAVGSMLSARAGHTSTLLRDGRVLIEGGWNGHRADAADDPPWDPMFAELFDPATSTFKMAGSMSTTRSGGPTATPLADGNVLVFGGIWSLQNVHEQPADPAYAQIYDVATDTFQPYDAALESLGRASATLLPDGRVLLIGSDASSGIARSASLLEPAKATLVWALDLATPRRGYSVTVLHDGRVLITGGTDANGYAVTTAELWILPHS